MNNIIETKDGFFVGSKVFAFADGVLGGKISKSKLGNYILFLFSDYLISSKKTKALKKELVVYNNPFPLRNEYENNVKNCDDITKLILEFKKRHRKKDLAFVYPKYEISDDIIPDIVKDMGYKIKRNIIPVKVSWNPERETVECYNIKGRKNFNTIFPKEFNPFEPFTAAKISKKEITFNDLVFILNKKDYDDAKNELNGFSKFLENINAPMTTAEIGKNKSLAYCIYRFTTNEEDDKEIQVVHELHHVINALLLSIRRAKTDAKQINVENLYKIEVHDELTANLEEVFHLINKYQMKGDYNDLSEFSSSRYKWLKSELKDKNNKQRKELVNDIGFIISGNQKNWFLEYYSHYAGKEDKFFYKKSKQFGLNLEEKIKDGRVLNIDDTDAEYLIQRNLMYKFKIYNPKTKKLEYRDIANEIKNDITLSREDMDLIVNPLNKTVKKRKKSLEKMNITDNLVQEYQMKLQDKNANNIKHSEYVFSQYVQNIR